MTITVPATSANLGPGFDTLGLAINLRNTVKITPAKFHSVSLKGEGAKNPKLKDNNMFINIFDDFHKNLSTKPRQFRFEFYNEVPLSRGLGSSSAVIISAIASAYAIEGIKLTKQKLLNLALQFESHPDNITPAVVGGFTAAIVEDNEVHYIKKSLPNDICAVVVIPNRPISTTMARKTLPFKYSKNDTIFNVSHSALTTAAFMSENWEMLREATKDRMHQYFRMKQMPELFSVQKVAYKNGALMSTLSGSGSTFFNLSYKKDAAKLISKLKDNFPHFKIYSYDFDNQGIIVDY
jgi:homoserine kinase